jgi:hypothetical protein
MSKNVQQLANVVKLVDCERGAVSAGYDFYVSPLLNINEAHDSRS